jgi:large subunit ribosomal protein L25
MVPANIFGHGESRAIQAPLRAIEHLLAHGGRTGLVSLTFDGTTPQTALMKGIQRDPRSGKITHVEFQAVSLQERVTSVVPVRFVGEAAAVTRLDGVMTHPVTQLRIEARAADLPDAIEVDVTPLQEIHASIKVSDLGDDPKYRVLDPPEEVLAVVLPPKIALELEAEAAEAEAAAAEEAPEGQPTEEQPTPEAPAAPSEES